MLIGLIISDKSDRSVVCIFNQMIGFVLREKEGRSYSSQTINSLSRGIKISVPMIPVEHIGEGAVDAAPPYFTTTFLRSQQKYKYYQNKERLFGKK